MNQFIDFIFSSREILVNGIGSFGSAYRYSGMSFLQGISAWDDILTIANIRTQPRTYTPMDIVSKMHIYEPNSYPPPSEILTLLSSISELYSKYIQSAPVVYNGEIAQSMKITSNRAQFLYLLFDSLIHKNTSQFYQAQIVLNSTLSLAQDMSKRFRVPAHRIASWRDNPTAYDYTYLWPAVSLSFWQRDLLKFWYAWNSILHTDPQIFSPCLYNIDNPAKVINADGFQKDIISFLYFLLKDLHQDWVADCLRVPTQPHYPFLPVPTSTP